MKTCRFVFTSHCFLVVIRSHTNRTKSSIEVTKLLERSKTFHSCLSNVCFPITTKTDLTLVLTAQFLFLFKFKIAIVAIFSIIGRHDDVYLYQKICFCQFIQVVPIEASLPFVILNGAPVSCIFLNSPVNSSDTCFLISHYFKQAAHFGLYHFIRRFLKCEY